MTNQYNHQTKVMQIGTLLYFTAHDHDCPQSLHIPLSTLPAVPARVRAAQIRPKLFPKLPPLVVLVRPFSPTPLPRLLLPFPFSLSLPLPSGGAAVAEELPFSLLFSSLPLPLPLQLPLPKFLFLLPIPFPFPFPTPHPSSVSEFRALPPTPRLERIFRHHSGLFPFPLALPARHRLPLPPA